MRSMVMAAGLALALAACGGDGRERSPATDQATGNGSNDVANQLAALPEGQRNAVFIRAIRDAGEDCQHVETSTRAGEYEGMPVWSAQCAGGPSWTIVVTRDGTAQLINDAEARLVGLDRAAPQNASATKSGQKQ